MTHPTDTGEELRDLEILAEELSDIHPELTEWLRKGGKKPQFITAALRAMSRARSTTRLMEVDVRGIALVAMDEQRKSGESNEMCARWISERVHKAAAQSPTRREKP